MRTNVVCVDNSDEGGCKNAFEYPREIPKIQTSIQRSLDHGQQLGPCFDADENAGERLRERLTKTRDFSVAFY